MGAVYSPKDKFKKRIDEVLKDLSPEVRDSVRELIENYRGEDLQKKLENFVGIKRTRELIDLR